MSDKGWKSLCADKRRRQQESIPKAWLVSPPPKDRLNVINFPRECGLLNPLELEITETDVETLLFKLAKGVWTSVDVTTAFYKRAILAHQVVNCLTEIFVEKALARALEMDGHLKRTGKVFGPLHGLPISLKDQISMKGLETVMGYVSWIGKYADRDAVLVEILYELGAVPFVRTNVPQTLMWPETFNHVFGRTTNPYNRSLTSGGSSGGEGALIGLHGSPLGIGSDIGGSIRIPANFNGLYGFRPSFNRIPCEGTANTLEGQVAIYCVLGPMSNSVFGLKAFTKAVIDAKPWRKDPLAIRKPWDEAAYQLSDHGGSGQGLVFAVMWNDGNVLPHPPIRRALELTKAALLRHGHKVIDWVPHKHQEMYTVTRAIWRAGSTQDFEAATAPSGEPVIHTMLENQNGPPSTKTRAILPSTVPVTAYELWQIHKRRSVLQKEYFDHWDASVAVTGTGRPVDAIIAPVAPFVAPCHGENRNADYTTVFNFLDYPAAVLPVTKVDQQLDVAKPPHEFFSQEDQQIYAMYDPVKFQDAPVGLQVVGRTQEDEAVLRMCEIVDECLKHDQTGAVAHL